MAGVAELVGREPEWRALGERFDRARAGGGGLLLVAGEAGVGKTSLVAASLDCSQLAVLRGIAGDRAKTPYGPIVMALRAYERTAPGALGGSGQLASQLSLLLPELGVPPTTVDQAALAEALRGAFVEVAGRRPTAVFLDDLQNATPAARALVV